MPPTIEDVGDKAGIDRLKFVDICPITALRSIGLDIMNWVMMKNTRQTIILLSAAMLAMNLSTVQAASFTQAFSNSISQSLVTLSNSSAKSSTNAANDLGQIDGDFKITRIAVAEDNDRMKIALQAPGADRDKDLNLYISAADYNHINLGVGQVITATQHAYGVAFSLEGTEQPFTVVLAAGWLHDTATQKVAL